MICVIAIYNQHQCSVVAIEEVPMDQARKYGIIAGNLVDETENFSGGWKSETSAMRYLRNWNNSN